MRDRWIRGSIATLLAFLFVLAAWTLLGATRDDPSSWRVVGQIGGPTQAVAVQGNYAYVGVGLRLAVLDVSDPTTLMELGSTAPFPHFVEGIVVSGTLAYIAAGGAGLRVVDVSDPANPTELGAWDSPGYAEGVAVSGSTAYLADGPFGLWTVDVSDSTHPTPLGSAYDMNYAFEVAVADDHAYIAAAGAGLLVADVSDPAHPVEVGSLDTPGYAYGVAVSGTTAYVADGWEGIRLIDVTNPLTPTTVSAYKTPGWAFGVAVSSTLAYVADAFKGLRVLDVSDATHPHELGGYEVAGGHAGNVAAAGSVAYVADRNWGLRVVSVANPASPTQVGFYGPLGYADGVAVAGNYAYVAAGSYGLRVVDVSEATSPKEVGSYDTHGYATSVVVVDQYAYVCTTSAGSSLYVVEITDPARPRLIGSTEIMGMCRDMAISAGIAYIPSEWGLVLIDFSDPSHPSQLGYIPLQEFWGAQPVSAVGVDVSGSLAYVATESAGLKIVNVSNPLSLTLVGAYKDESSFSQDVAVAGGRAYVADTFGLRAVDVSNPAHPTGIGFYGTPGQAAYGVVVSGAIAYVADGRMGVSAVDVSNPFSPTLAGAFNTLGHTHDVAVVGNRVYVADGPSGLLILESATGSALSNVLANPSHDQLGCDIGTVAAQVSPRQRLLTSSWSYPHTVPQMLPRSAPIADTLGHLDSPVANPASQITGTCVVTATADSGQETLRLCLENAVAGDTITFSPSVFPPTTPVTIALASPLPLLNQGGITIDATNAGVILDGSNTPANTNGIQIASDGNVICGLQIMRFPGNGVAIAHGAKHNVIGGDRTIGTGPMGQGNLISGNGGGVWLCCSDVVSNTVIGNFIGTDVSGRVAFGNRYDGVFIYGAQQNLIGGRTAGERNVISGNGRWGVNLWGMGVMSNTVIGNYIGTNAIGTAAIGNTQVGVVIGDGAEGNLIGGIGTGEGNLISGNEGDGVSIENSHRNIVAGNYIGVDASGVSTLGNRGAGVSIHDGSQHNMVGPGNMIAYNANAGIQVNGTTTLSNTITANSIHSHAGKGIILSNGGNNMLPAPVITTVTPTGVSGTACPGCTVEIFSDNEDEGQVYEGSTTATTSGFFTFTKTSGLTGRNITATATDKDGNTSELSAPVMLFYETHMMTSTLDNGPGTLRQAMQVAGMGDTITFDPSVFPPTRPVTIALSSQLPSLTQGNLTIDASNAGVILDGSGAPPGTAGLVIISNDNTIKGLQILRFPGDGIQFMDGAKNNLIGGDRLRGSGLLGEGNLLSGNGDNGINLHGGTANIVVGNYIGTDIHGATALGNRRGGVNINSSGNRIGGVTAAERNIIGGNVENGIYLVGPEASGNTIVGNYLGTDASGRQDLGNGHTGIALVLGANNNHVERNLISGNMTGVAVSDWGSSYNVIVGNLIGSDASGTWPIPNDEQGVFVGFMGPSFNRVGGTGAGEGNLISGNGIGVSVYGPAADGNLILGNYIGIDITGAHVLGNAHAGVNLGASRTFIGGMAPGERNIISGNDAPGVNLSGDYNFLVGNYIGTSASGLEALGNNADGAMLQSGERNVIQGNLIAHNAGDGVEVHAYPHNTIRRNFIYSNTGKGIETINGGNNELAPPLLSVVSMTTVVGTAVPNTTIEVFSDNAGQGRLFEGSTTATASGLFTFTKTSGLTGPRITATATDQDGNTSEFSAPVVLFYETYVVTSTLDNGPGTLRQAMQAAGMGDTITFDPSVFPPTSPVTIALTSPLPLLNQGGVTIDASNAGVILEGSDLASGSSGIVIVSSGNVVKGLQILRFPADGVAIREGAQRNIIGGDRSRGSGPLGQGNLISGNNWAGIEIAGRGTTNNLVQGNLIGTDASGRAALGNYHGILIYQGAQNNLIGGSTPGTGNVIAGNTWIGIDIDGSGTTGNVVAGNLIGTDATGTQALGNAHGVWIVWGAQHNRIGGSTVGERNVISGNRDQGVGLLGSGAVSNTIVGNFIGTDATGTAPLGNGGVGVSISSESQCNSVGPDNSIAYNGSAGVQVDGPTTLGNTITANPIHSHAGKGIILSNGGNNMLPAPVITTVTATGISGTACPGCTVEVFSDAEDEGRVYEGSASASAAGVFTFAKPAGLTGPFITATATDRDGDTSEFSAPPRLTCPDFADPPGVGVEDIQVVASHWRQTADPPYDLDGDRIITIVDIMKVSARWGETCSTKASGLTGPYVTATATDLDGNTSEFSTPQRVWRKWIYLPVILKGR
jgi:hypothetical protein